MITQRLSVRDLKRKLDAGDAMLILDVRAGFCDADQMIPGAIHVDARDLNPQLFNLPHDVAVVVYGTLDQDDATMKVAEALRAAGFNAEALQGGWNGWIDAGFPTEARHERPLPRSKGELRSSVAPQAPATETAAEAPASKQPETDQRILAEARERVQETTEEALHGFGDLASRALRLVQTLIRR